MQTSEPKKLIKIGKSYCIIIPKKYLTIAKIDTMKKYYLELKEEIAYEPIQVSNL